MGSLRRILISFVILFDTLAFALIFLIMSNTSESGQVDLIYMAESDGTRISVTALIGVVANIGLGYVLLRGSIAARRLDTRDRLERRTRITGE